MSPAAMLISLLEERFVRMPVPDASRNMSLATSSLPCWVFVIPGH